LEQPAQSVVDSVLADGAYLTCTPDTDSALDAFLRQTTMSGSQRAMVVEAGGRYHWFLYQIEDVITGEFPA
jgi:hypothetical protein